jgi:hypothetical protein
MVVEISLTCATAQAFDIKADIILRAAQAALSGVFP